MIRNSPPSLLLGLLLLATLGVGVSRAETISEVEAIPEVRRLDFMVGDWTVEAWIRQSPIAVLKGQGTMKVYWAENGETLLAQMDIKFPTFAVQGVTKRTFNPTKELWEISWNPTIEGRQVYPHIEGKFNGEHFVELNWGEDAYGSLLGRLVISNISQDFFKVRKDRLYDDGTLLEEIWAYEARRIK